MAAWCISGRVTDGLGRGAGFTGLPWVRRQFLESFGIDPFPGTLNLQITADAEQARWQHARATALTRIQPPPGEGCEARCLPVTVGAHVPALVVIPDVPGYPSRQIEIVAAVSLREALGLRSGDELQIAACETSEVRAVVFDLDGTLVNSLEGIHLAAVRAAALFGYEVPYEYVRRAMNTGESLWELVIPQERRGDPELVHMLRKETLRHWPEALAGSVRAFPGLGETLQALHSAGIRLAICTGSRGEAFFPLQRAGLMKFFDPVITAHDVDQPKPHPQGLQRCLERLGYRPEEALYVGDSRHDVEAGRAAGMRVIGVLTGAADSASLSAAGAHRLAAGHHQLLDIVLPAA